MAKATTAGKKKVFRKKEKKNIPVGIAYIAATFNNTMISITDLQVTLKIGDRDHRVIERRRDIGDPNRDVLLLFLPKDLLLTSGGCFCHMKLLLAGCLLLRNRSPPRSFACARVGMCALSPHWQSTPMPQSAIGADVHQTLDVHLHALAQITLDFSLSVNHRTDAGQIFLAQISDLDVAIYLCLIEDRRRTRSPNPVNVCKADLCTLIGRKIYTCNTSHLFLSPRTEVCH